MKRQHVHIAVIIVVTALILFLNLLTLHWVAHHRALHELFYIPLLFGVLRFGYKGALATYLFVSTAYVSFIVGVSATTVSQEADPMLHLGVSGVVTLFAALLVTRREKRHLQAEHERYFSGIGQAATIIVHDLKNPLISILGFARRIQEGKGDTALAALTITKAAQDMQRIVNEVLEFARPLNLNPTEGDIRQSIQRACETCRTKAEESGVKLAVNLPQEPLISRVDCFQLERAMVNLLDNSVDASSRGGEVAVTAVAGMNKLTIAIKDSGVGMDKETLDNLFTLTYTTKNEGTGFGVPISKKIIEAHGGTIGISSQKNCGTEVLIILPLRAATH